MELVKRTRVSLVPYAQAIRTRGRTISIPTDVPTPAAPEGAYATPFNGTTLRLWNPLPLPQDWTPFPEGTPLWFRHPSGALMPAWNLFGNCQELLTLQEERSRTDRDEHGRFIASMSPRFPAGLLDVPAVNEAIAALVGAAAGLDAGTDPLTKLDGLVNPPVLVLSHDNDQLRGNDLWTQAVRIYRIVQPVAHGRAPRLGNLWWAARNSVRPRTYYYENVLGMIDVERMLGFESTLYTLNGTRGRFGARSGQALIAPLIRDIPEGWPVGMHYNFDTHLDEGRFNEQKSALEQILGRAIVAGRAHYLRFDPERSFRFWDDQGIRCDESLGYPDFPGYRAGIAGPFQVYDPVRGERLGIWEVPMVFMDGALLSQYASNAAEVFEHHIAHLSRVGGALSLLFHPGVFFNPELPVALGLYRRLLGIARDFQAVSFPAEFFARS